METRMVSSVNKYPRGTGIATVSILLRLRRNGADVRGGSEQ